MDEPSIDPPEDLWKPYLTVPILEETFTNGDGLNWSPDHVLTVPTFHKKRINYTFTKEESEQKSEKQRRTHKGIRLEKRFVAIRLFALRHPGVLAENARYCYIDDK